MMNPCLIQSARTSPPNTMTKMLENWCVKRQETNKKLREKEKKSTPSLNYESRKNISAVNGDFLDILKKLYIYIHKTKKSHPTILPGVSSILWNKLAWDIGSSGPPWQTFKRMIIPRNKASLNRSTTSWHDSWKRLCLSNFLKTELLISAKLFEMRRVSSAWWCQQQR